MNFDCTDHLRSSWRPSLEVAKAGASDTSLVHAKRICFQHALSVAPKCDLKGTPSPHDLAPSCVIDPHDARPSDLSSRPPDVWRLLHPSSTTPLPAAAASGLSIYTHRHHAHDL